MSSFSFCFSFSITPQPWPSSTVFLSSSRQAAITKSEGFQYGIIYQEKETGPELKSEAQFYGENVPRI